MRSPRQAHRCPQDCLAPRQSSCRTGQAGYGGCSASPARPVGPPKPPQPRPARSSVVISHGAGPKPEAALSPSPKRHSPVPCPGAATGTAARAPSGPWTSHTPARVGSGSTQLIGRPQSGQPSPTKQAGGSALQPAWTQPAASGAPATVRIAGAEQVPAPQSTRAGRQADPPRCGFSRAPGPQHGRRTPCARRQCPGRCASRVSRRADAAPDPQSHPAAHPGRPESGE